MLKNQITWKITWKRGILKQFGIWVFLEVQTINFLAPLKVNMNILYFYMNVLHFMKKFLPLLTMQVFFQNILLDCTPSNPNDIFYWFFLVDIKNYNICSFTKKPGNLLERHKKTQAQKFFLGVHKRIECLQRNIFDRFRFIDFESEQVQREGLFNLNWRRDLNMVFFTITWKATYMDKSILKNIVVCYQNKNP